MPKTAVYQIIQVLWKNILKKYKKIFVPDVCTLKELHVLWPQVLIRPFLAEIIIYHEKNSLKIEKDLFFSNSEKKVLT